MWVTALCHSMKLWTMPCRVTQDGDCNHKIKRCLLLGRKSMINIENVVKGRHHSPDNGVHSQSYGLSSRSCECWRIDPFKLWCWRWLLRVPWTAKTSNQWILKEIDPKYSLDKLMLKMKFHCFTDLLWRASILEKTLMLGKIESRKRRGQWRMRWLDGIRNSVDMHLRDFWKTVKEKESWYATVQEFAKSQSWLSHWTMNTNKVPKTVHDTKQMLKNIFN